MIIFDANVWIALLNNQDSLHKKAEQIYGTIKETIIIPEYIAIEICNILSLKAGKPLANTFIDIIENNTDIVFLASNETSFYQTLTFFKTHDHKSLSFIDVSLLYLSKSHTIYTFDKKLEKAIKKKF